MTFAELVASVADDAGITKRAAGIALESVRSTITAFVMREGETFSWPGLGSFRRSTHKAKRVINPQTGQPMRTRASELLAFRASKHQRRRAKR